MYCTVYPMTCIDSSLLYEPHWGTNRRNQTAVLGFRHLDTKKKKKQGEEGMIWRSFYLGNICCLRTFSPIHFP